MSMDQTEGESIDSALTAATTTTQRTKPSSAISSRSLSRSHHSSSDSDDSAGVPEVSTRASNKSNSSRDETSVEFSRNFKAPTRRGRTRTKSLEDLDKMIQARSQSRSQRSEEAVQNVMAAQTRSRSKEGCVDSSSDRLKSLNETIRERSRSRHRTSLADKVAEIRARSVSRDDNTTASGTEAAGSHGMALGQASALDIGKESASLASRSSSSSPCNMPSERVDNDKSPVPVPKQQPSVSDAITKQSSSKPSISSADKKKKKVATTKKKKDKESTTKTKSSKASNKDSGTMPPVPGLPTWYAIDPNNPPIRVDTSSKQRFTPEKQVETIDEYIIFLQDGTMDVKTISKVTDKPTWHIV